MTNRKKTTILLWAAVLSPLVLLVCCLSLATIGAFGALPTIEQLENPKSNLASEVVSADGVVLGKYFYENRTHIEYKDLSPHIVNALAATEDERFFKHAGIDFKALLRAAKGVATGDRSKGGGSTITQQLAKMLFSKGSSSKGERALRKFKEWAIALKLESQFTKEEILTMYLNRFDFLHLAVGVESAARIYFNTSPAELAIEQAATLVGMAKNPSLYNPKSYPKNALKRRNVVFGQMLRNDMLTEEEADSLKKIPLVLDYHSAGHHSGLATYLRENLRGFMRRWIKENPKEDGSLYNLYSDGLKIYTTIDSRMQRYAEQAVEQHLTEHQALFFRRSRRWRNPPFPTLSKSEVNFVLEQGMKQSHLYKALKKEKYSDKKIKKVFNTPKPMRIFSWEGYVDTMLTPMDSVRYYKTLLQTGFMSINPKNGHIKAWVGGIDYESFQYDHVVQGKRQVGSTFKPFVYATAIVQKQLSPCFEVPNMQVRFEKETFGLLEDWMPRNSDDAYGGMLTLKAGLAGSVNTITAHLMKEVGSPAVIKMARSLGITSPIPSAPSICLGTADLSVFEMVGAYATFANKGVYNKPYYLLRIENNDGVVLGKFTTKVVSEPLSEESAFTMLSLLQGVTAKGGTGYRLRFKYHFENEIAGKTGTTQENSDGWFVGVTPDLVSGAWVGCEDRGAHFSSTSYGQGAATALPIWALYMQQVYADTTLGIMPRPFDSPVGGTGMELDCDLYQKNNSNVFDDEF